jgi:hypothetical protein
MNEKDVRSQRARELSLDRRNNDLADVRLKDEDAGVRDYVSAKMLAREILRMTLDREK